MSVIPFRPRPVAAAAAEAARAPARERVLAHAVAVFVKGVPADADVDANDADEVRAAVDRYAPADKDAVEEALFHHGAAVFGARVQRARSGL